MIFNRYFIRILSCFACLFTGLVHQTFAADVLIVAEQNNIYSLAPYFSILEDPSGQLSIDDVKLAKYSKQFKKNTDADLSLGFSSSTFWLRLQIKNNSPSAKPWLIQQKYTHTHLMDVYLQANNYKPQYSGTLIPLPLRDIHQRDITFTVNLPEKSEQTIFMRLESHGAISLDIDLLTEQAFIEKNANVAVCLGLFYGMMFIMIVYNLFFFISLKEFSYLYLTLFITFCGAVYFLYDGFAALLFNQSLLLFTPYLLPMFMGLSSIAIIFHCRAFLEIQSESLFSRRLQNTLLILWPIVISLIPFIDLTLAMNIVILLVLLTACSMLFTTFICWRQNNPGARYAIAGWGIFAFFIVLMSLARLQLIPDYFIFEQLSRIGLITLVLLLSIALADRINRLKISNDHSLTALVNSEMLRNLALDAGQLGVWRWQIASDSIFWSERTCQIYGVDSDKTPNSFEEYRSFIHPDDMQYLENVVEDAIEQHQSFSLQHRIIRTDGSEVWLQCYGKIEFDEHNNLVGTVGTVQDITHQKQLEIEKRQSQELYENVFSSATEGFIIRTLEGKTLQANPAICQMYGYTKDEFFALNLKDLVHPDSKKGLDEYYDSIKKKHAYFGEVKRIRKDGSVMDIEVHASLIDYQGKPHVFSIVHDITERKQTENIIKGIAKGVTSSTSEAFLQHLVIQMAKLFDAHFVFINLIDENEPAVLKPFIACVEGEVVDNNPYSFSKTAWAKLLECGNYVYSEKVQELFPNEKLLTEINAESFIGTPLFNAEGASIGVIVVIDTKPMTNIDQSKEIIQIFAARAGAELSRLRAQNELKNYQDQLEATVIERTAELESVNHELESFSYSVSHDLRSPLRAIDGFSKALLDEYEDKFDEEGHDLLKRVRKNTLRMGKLIDDLLNLSRLGRTKLKNEKLDLGQIANEIIKDLRESEPGRQVEFKCSVSDHIMADPELIRIALDNLLNNAWKYSSKSTSAIIEFGKATENGITEFFIRDNGVGFDMAYVSKLFGAFQRLHGREFEGSGIGLATVQRIIHRHHGSIRVDAKIDEGATFFFTLNNIDLDKNTP